MNEAQTTIRGVRLLALALLAWTGTSCSSPPAPPPKPPKQLTAHERILQTAKSWREMSLSEGYVNQPDVAFLRVQDSLTLILSDSATSALMDITRKEMIRSPEGREFHCEVKGAVNAAVRFAWRNTEASVEVHMPPAALPRKCREPGFPRNFKEMPGFNATYVLRGDHLMAVEPITLRSEFLPVD